MWTWFIDSLNPLQMSVREQCYNSSIQVVWTKMREKELKMSLLWWKSIYNLCVMSNRMVALHLGGRRGGDRDGGKLELKKQTSSLLRFVNLFISCSEVLLIVKQTYSSTIKARVKFWPRWVKWGQNFPPWSSSDLMRGMRAFILVSDKFTRLYTWRPSSLIFTMWKWKGCDIKVQSC